jgi:hypothetical protein
MFHDSLDSITRPEIHRILHAIYSKRYGSTKIDRPLIEHGGDNYVTGEFKIFALTGSPPKAYALWVSDLHRIEFFGPDLKKCGDIYLQGGVVEQNDEADFARWARPALRRLLR